MPPQILPNGIYGSTTKDLGLGQLPWEVVGNDGPLAGREGVHQVWAGRHTLAGLDSCASCVVGPAFGRTQHGTDSDEVDVSVVLDDCDRVGGTLGEMTVDYCCLRKLSS